MSQKTVRAEFTPGPALESPTLRRSARLAKAMQNDSCGSSASVFVSYQSPIAQAGSRPGRRATASQKTPVDRAIAAESQSGRQSNIGLQDFHNAKSLGPTGGGSCKVVTLADPGRSTPNKSEFYQAALLETNANHELRIIEAEESLGAVGGYQGATFRNPVTQDYQVQESEIRKMYSSILKNPEAENCKFCYIKLDTGEGVMLQECLHVFCRECLQAAIETQKGLATIPCPVADELNCGGFISNAEVKALVGPEVYEEYLDRSLNIYRKKKKNVFECTTPGCKGWCEYELGRKTFLCPLCSKSFCVMCQAAHDGLTCDVYQTLKNTGQLAKVDELMDKERRNGWSQLLDIMNANGNTADLQLMLEQMDSLELLENCSEFECPICLTDVEVGAGAILKECLHLFCKDCLTGLVEHSDDPTIKCPYIDGNYSCICFVQEREIRKMVPRDIYEKHLERSIKLGENTMDNTFHCKTPDCRGWCVYDEGVIRFTCETCGKTNCIACNTIHEGLSCEDYKNRIVQNTNDKLSAEAVQALIDTGKAMRCPKCQIPVEKVVGCDWLQCTACRTELCWATRGPRWGPKGKGDLSGGCRCRAVNNKPCTPKCGNCH